MLDKSLRRPAPEDATRGVYGELWAVHGGGFYSSQKYLTGPERRSADGAPAFLQVGGLHDVAVRNGLAGDALLVRREHVPDRPVGDDLPVPAAIALSAGSLVAGWLVYDQLCRRVRHELALALILYAALTAAGWGGPTHRCSVRARPTCTSAR